MMSIKSVILCCAVFMCFTLSRSQNNFFMAKQYSSENYICVTNTSYALSWIRENTEETLDLVSTYIPKTNGIDYDIKNDYNTVQYFQKEPWLIESSYGDLILDERWEEFKVTKTEAKEDYGAALVFYHVLNNLTDNFEVFFSIRIHEEGHIFLCDAEDPTKSNCYWLLLQAFRNSGTAIRKCGKNQIPGIWGEWPHAMPCSTRRVDIRHPEVPRYLSEKKWSHFVLSKRENTLTFSKIVDFQKITIMEWRDPDSPISVKNMFIHNKRVSGLWKMHFVDYIVTTQESKDVHLGPLIYAADGLICISMYIAMCPSCKMKFSLAVDHVIIYEEFYESQGQKWTNIKLLKYTNVTYGVKLLVSTTGSLQGSFWAIDKIRRCLPQEFRQFVLVEPATCQLMSGAKDVISFRKNTTPFPQIDNNCPETTIGPFCVPCDWILDHCERMKFCTKDECQCSAGYTGDSCYDVCDTQKYGHSCRKTCGKCFYGLRFGFTCNNINGDCPSEHCTDDHTGPKCDRPSTIIFAKAPKVINVTYSSAIIQITDFEVKDLPKNHTFSQYIIQFKGVEDTDWMHLLVSFRFYDFFNITIDNLKSGTKYLVRRVIISGDKWQLGDHLLSTEFKTLCIEITDSNIMVETQNTSASILIIQITDIMCKSHIISMDNGRSPVFRNGTFAYFNDLTPFTEYMIKIENQNFVLKKTIKTTITPPDIPSLSSNATFSSTDNSITVSSSVQEIGRQSDSLRMIILRSDKQTNVNMFQELEEFNLSDLKVVVDCNITAMENIRFNIIIGNDQQFNDSYVCEDIDNFPLDPGTSYNVSIALINSFNGKSRVNIYSYSVNTTGQPLGKSGLFALLILLLLIPLAVILYFKRNQLISLKNSIFKENNTCNNRLIQTQLSTLQPSANTDNISHNINSHFSKNEANSIDSNTIPAKKLKNYIKQSVQNQELKKEYMSLVNTITTYDTVLDRFRIEYVDVEYKKKFQFNKAYIVCKAPTLLEFEEFWEIVWYENVKHLIFLEDVRTTTSLNNYWPDQNQSICYGNIAVKCNTCQISNFCICRQFTIQAKNISKQIFQLHLCLPQDDYFYLSSLNYIAFFQKLSQIPYSATSPILVHSSSGLKGASFTLLCDISLKFLKEEGGVNVMQELQKLIRISPELMIDYEHYLAAHAVIFEILCQIKTSVDCRSSEHLKHFDKNNVQKHLKYLRDTLWLDVINAEEYDDRYIYFQADSTKCDGSLQCKAISIDKENCPFLKTHKLFKINDFKTSPKFCVTQQPTIDTMDDFLDLIIKDQISFVIILNQSLQMWPTPRTPVMKINDDVVVKHQETKNLKTYDWIIVKISNNSVEYTVKILIFKNWIPPAHLPDLTEFVDFVIESNHLCKDLEFILVTCSNGVTASGLYVAMSYSFRQIEEEKVCDVCTSIRIIRRYYEDFLKEDEQYVFLLEAVYKYMQQSSIYTEIK